MSFLATRCRSVIAGKDNILCTSRRPCLLFLAFSSEALSKTGERRRRGKKTAWDEGRLSWEERLSDAVTPLWRLSYEQQLQVKLKHQERIMSQLSRHLSEDFRSPSSSSSSPSAGKPSFPVLPVLPSPVRNGYRNKSTFSVNKGVDGNPKTVGYYIGTGREGNIVCVNGDHLFNMPEKHKLVARCYQDFIRSSPLDPCLLFHTGGHWREVTVRTNAQGQTMVIVYFHPQTLTPEEVAVHKAELVDYFTRGPGSLCKLDSLFFQESSMTRCTHEESPYQLLYGQPYMYEEVMAHHHLIPSRKSLHWSLSALKVKYKIKHSTGYPKLYKVVQSEIQVHSQCKQGSLLKTVMEVWVYTVEKQTTWNQTSVKLWRKHFTIIIQVNWKRDIQMIIFFKIWVTCTLFFSSIFQFRYFLQQWASFMQNNPT